MKRRDQIDGVFLEALRRASEQRSEEVCMPDIIAQASDVIAETAIEPPRLHRFGSALLRLAGRRGIPYKPNASNLFYDAIYRLRDKGHVEAREDPLHFDLQGNTPRLLYRLADGTGK
jgi:hypothetical protein